MGATAASLAGAAGHERRRAPQELLGSPRWPPWMGTAAAGRRKNSGRWPETTRGVIRHSPQLGGCHLANNARRAFVLRGHFCAFARQSSVHGTAQRRAAARAVLKPSPAQTCRAGLKRQKIGLCDQIRPSIPLLFWVCNPAVPQARKVGLNIELDNLDHRVIGEALVERVGRLIEIVEDTTRTTSERRAASRELKLLMSVLCKLIEPPAGPLN